MNTAILVFILIMIAIGIFYIGALVGCMNITKKFKNAFLRISDETDLSHEQIMEILDIIEKELKK